MKKSKIALTSTLLAGALAVTGCAQIPTEQGGDPRDPWEPVNRWTFGLNQGFDKVIFRPLAKGYEFIAPEPVRIGIRGIFRNTMEPANAVNSSLQGKVEQGILSLFRLVINSTVGVGGFFDVAAKVDIPRKETDFGETLRVWGIPNGPYIIIPILGPSTLRDGLGMIPEVALDPNTYIGEAWFTWPWWGVKFVTIRAQLLPVTDLLQHTVDPYIATRNAYLQNRQSVIQEEEGITILTPQDLLLNPLDYEDEAEDAELIKKEKKE
ncbi:MAG: VacJ family lipoprotein [Burkholderiales bacterium]|nr:VacJ family lipoprotein [Burkholderiales bacterium]